MKKKHIAVSLQSYIAETAIEIPITVHNREGVTNAVKEYVRNNKTYNLSTRYLKVYTEGEFGIAHIDPHKVEQAVELAFVNILEKKLAKQAKKKFIPSIEDISQDLQGEVTED